MTADPVDLLIIGGGINGTGIARDAAGRGLSVVLAEKDDLAAHTSSSSSKLIHGGLRYLEQFEFRLVAEALTEREILLRTARHLVWPARFIMPHVPGLRPRWMIRAGLFLYDHLARRDSLPGSQAVRLDRPPYADGLQSQFSHGFMYSDCRVDDARLVISNAMDARQRGAEILTRTECLSARREDRVWRITLGNEREIHARAIVNAAGPWVKQVLDGRLGQSGKDRVRLVKGSHIVLPQLNRGDHAFILQNDDRRVVFMIPYGESHTLVGTTDVPYDSDPGAVQASDAEVDYLCRAAGRYLRQPVLPSQVVWRYAGVRPLHDDGGNNPSAISRDYTLRVNDDSGHAPVLSIYGGKVTTYRRLAEHALHRLAPCFPGLRDDWTASAPLPGGDFAGSTREQARDVLFDRHRNLPQALLRSLFRRHGMLAHVLLDGVTAISDLGQDFGAGLYAREVDWFIDQEWAAHSDDVLWRRTKCGLQLTRQQRQALADHVKQRVS
ncbi:MAG: glycerol-3-phosphate dehydrogenase [Burkholderiales bacterium]